MWDLTTRIAGQVIYEKYRPELDKLLEKNNHGYHSLDSEQKEKVDEFLKIVLEAHKEQFSDIYEECRKNKHQFAKQYFFIKDDLAKLLQSEEREIGLVATFEFKGLTPEATKVAHRMGVATINWELLVLRKFFEAKWSQSIEK